MHNHKKTGAFYIFSRIFRSLCAFLFFSFIIFAFDTPYTAAATLIAALFHECGHKIALLSVRSRSTAPIPRLFGFKIKSESNLSYGNDILCASAGPGANLLVCFLSFPLCFVNKDAYCVFAVINIATALANLLPIKGYDGYRIITSLILLISPKEGLINIIEAFSLIMMCAFVFLSLYLIGKFNEGYWIFIIFFSALLCELSKSSRLIKIENK